MRKAFLDSLSESLERDPSVMLLTADTGFHVFDHFQKEFPDNYLNVGISEAAMIGLAAGLSMAGRKVFVYAIAPFATLRCLEQIRCDLCCQNLPVKIVGVGAGLTYGASGPTHHTIEDIAVMNCLPNMTVFCPGDPLETEAAVWASLELTGPCYLRLGKSGEPPVHVRARDFKVGKGITLQEGSDLALLATGNMLACAREVADMLATDYNLAAELISIPTIKPLDRHLIAELSGRHSLMATLEEHSLIGGLGSLVANVLVEQAPATRLLKFGIPDVYAEVAGSQEYLRGLYGLLPDQIVKKIIEIHRGSR